MALPFPGNSLRLLFRRRRLAALLIAGGLGLMQAPAASAAPFTGVCPVLGTTQPPYPQSLLPLVPPNVTTLPLAIPQVPVRVSVDGQDLPICAVYMSINDSLRPVADVIAELSPPNTLILPPVVPNDLLFPDLRAQPWFTAPGGSFAQAIARALADNGYWDIGGIHQWKNEGQGFLVNDNPTKQPTDSYDSAYFLWDVVGGDKNSKGKSRVVWYNTSQAPNPPTTPINWLGRDNDQLDPNTRYWFWVLDAPGDANDVPGPVPLLGAAAAFRCSRQLRRRLAAAR
jgi:hypothetical protein